jgi:hypothetical protein
MADTIWRVKDVHVCAYNRTLLGKREHMREHWRSHPHQYVFDF